MANPFDQFDEQASSNPFDQFDEQVDQFDEKKEKRATWGETGKALVDMLGEVGTSSVGGLMQASGELEKERLENALAATDRAVVLEAGMKSDPSAYKGLKSLGEFNKQFLSDIAPTEWKGKYQYAKQEVDRERKESERRADIGKLMFESSTRRQEKIRPDFKEKDWGKEFAFDVGVAAEKMVPPIIVGAITRNPALATAAMGPTVYGDMYGAQRMAGRAPDQAHQDAIASTVIELGTELPVFGRLFKFGRGGLKKIFDTTVLEGLSEGISSLLSTAYDAGVVNDDMTLAEAFTSAKTYQDALYEAAVGTALGGLMGGGVVPFDVAEQKKTIKFIKDSTADMQFQMMSDEQLSNMIKVGDQLSSEYGDQELSKFIDVLRSEQEIRADSKNQAEIAPQTIPDVTLESIGLPPSDAGISTAIDKIANAQNINEILSAVEDGVFKPIETPTIEAPTVESQNQQLIDQYFPETLPPMPVPGMTDIGPHRVIQNRMPETPTPEVTYGATRPDGGTTPEGSTGESIDTGRGMESVEPDRVPRSDVRDRMDIPQEPMASGGAAVSVGEPIVTKTLKKIRAEKALVQEKPEVAPTKATGDEVALIEGAKKSKSLSDFKSWSIGRFGREKASELSSSGAIQKAWDQKSEVVTAKPEIEAAANEAATSPENNIPEPTQAQKEAGNYKVGRVSLHGMNISIENPKGSIRSGVDSDGESWNVEMKHHYGYIRNTVGKDKDHLDVFVGPEAENANLPVFVVDQINPNTKAFDEHKILLGFKNKLAAKRGYLSNYGNGWNGIGAVNKMTLDEFKGWIKSGDTTKAISYKEARKPFVKPTQEPIVEEKAAAEKEAEREAARAKEKPVAEQTEEQRPSEYEEMPKFMASDQTKTEAFNRWFGYSKVVDENGEPLVVYHGGPSKIEAFDEGFAGMTTADNEHGAFYFSDTQEIGEDYSRQAFIRRYQDDPEGLVEDGLASEKEVELHQEQDDVYEWVDELAEDNINVVAAYGKMENPLVVDAGYQGLREFEKGFNIQDAIGFIKGKQVESIPDIVYDEMKYNEDDVASYKSEIEERARENNDLESNDSIDDWMLDEATQEVLDENGIYTELPKYDGLIIKNVIDDISEKSSAYQDLYIFTDPTQIKSITNKGTFNPADERINFKAAEKTASAMPRKELDAAIDEISGKWKGGPKIVVAESVDALPGEITSNPEAKKMMESLKSIVGISYKGSIYVIGNKIDTTEQVERVLFHEAYGHYGLSRLFGNEIPAKLNQIYFGIGRSKWLNALAEKHGIDLTKYYKGTEGLTVEERRALLTEELLAHIATDSKPSIARKAKEVIGAIRQWLRDHGLLRLSKISDAEIMYLLKQARESVVTGKAGKGFNSDVRFMIESESSSNQLNKIIKGLHLEGDHATAAWYEQRMKSAKNIDRLLTQIKAEQEMPMFMSDSKNDATAVTMPKGRKAVEKFYDSLVYNIVDRFKDLKDIQKEIGEVPEPADAFLAQENFSGRARKRMDDLDDFHVRPLLKEMTKANISMEEAGKFLHARHAEEANAILKRRNPSETDLRNRINEIRQEQNDLYDNEDVAKYRKLKNSLDKAVNDVNESQSDETQTEILRGQINDLKSKSSEVKRYINLTERLAAAKKLNPYKGDNTALSGMSDEEAREILESYKNNAAMQDVAKRIDAINKEHLNKMVADEILTKEEANAWRKNYEKYVPLHRDEFIDEDGELIPLPSLPKKGQGYNIAGKESKLRTGSTKEVNHALIIPHVIAQYEASAIRGEKNIVNQALYELVKLYPDSNLWEIDKVEKRPSLNKDGEVIYQAGPRLYDNELDLKIKGESVKITFNNANPRARRLVRELKNLAGRDMPQFLRYTNTVMRYLSLVNTSLSPEFVLSNFARDLQTAGYNLGDTDLANMKARIIKDTVRHAVKGMWKNLRHDHSTEWSKYADEFERAGGMVGWIDSYDSIHDKAKRLERDMKLVGKGHIARKALRGLGEWIENANSAIENGVRLSAFVNARKMGMSSAKAANLAKNLTVNFNRRGAQSQYLNMAYLFFNASVQGSARMIAAVGKSAKVRRMVGATIIAAAILDIVNRSISGDDDDDRKYYDKIPTGIKDRNLIIMFGDGPEDFIKIPLPWGYNIFHIMGQMIGRGVSNYTGDDIKDYSVADEGARFLGATMEAFNPVASGTLMQTISPTLLDPAVMIAENKSWTGQPLMPEKIPFGPPKPRSEMYFRSASEPSKYIAETLNSLTGGNRLRPGVIDWSPEWIDELWSTSTGSAGRFLLNTIDTGAKIASGEEVERRNIPFARKILGNEYPSSDYELYYERKDDLSILANELKTFRGEERSAVIRDAGPKRKLIGLMKTTEKKLRILRKRRRLLEDKRASKEEIEKVTDQILSVIKLFNKRYQDTVNE